jgi:pyruvate formate lyase activating enzyme
MIAALQKCSLIDFPGCLSAVVFMRGCNLRCPYCHNAQLIPDGPGRIGTGELLDFLASRRGRLDGVVYTGGEPTLRPELPELMASVRALGYAVKLDTNGTRPEVLAALLDGQTLDYIAMDLKDEPESYAGWLGLRADPEAIALSLDLVKTSHIDHELRTTVVLPYHDHGRLDRMARFARGCGAWILQPYRSNVKQSRNGWFQEPPDEYLEEQAALIRERYGIACRTRRDRRVRANPESARTTNNVARLQGVR